MCVRWLDGRPGCEDHDWLGVCMLRTAGVKLVLYALVWCAMLAAPFVVADMRDPNKRIRGLEIAQDVQWVVLDSLRRDVVACGVSLKVARDSLWLEQRRKRFWHGAYLRVVR